MYNLAILRRTILLILSIIESRLVSLRKAKGISQLKLAKITKLDRTYLSRVEHGKQNITMTTLILLCNCLDITLKDFLISKS